MYKSTHSNNKFSYKNAINVDDKRYNPFRQWGCYITHIKTIKPR